MLFLLICHYHHLLLNLNNENRRYFQPYSLLLLTAYNDCVFILTLRYFFYCLSILFLVLYYLIPAMLLPRLGNFYDYITHICIDFCATLVDIHPLISNFFKIGYNLVQVKQNDYSQGIPFSCS